MRETLWYHGSSGTDLLFNHDPKGEGKDYWRFTVYLLGTYIQWDRAEGVSTGCVRSSENRSDFRSEEWGVLQFETMIMTPDRAPDPQKLSIAKALFLSSNLALEFRNWCVERLGVT